MRKLKRPIDVLVRVESLMALAIGLPTFATSVAAVLLSSPSWCAWALLTLGFVISYSLLVWWIDRKISDRLSRLEGRVEVARRREQMRKMGIVE